MAKKTDRKLSLKRETLRTLSDDQLRAVGGGDQAVMAGGLIGTSRPPSNPTGESIGCVQMPGVNFVIKYYP